MFEKLKKSCNSLLNRAKILRGGKMKLTIRSMVSVTTYAHHDMLNSCCGYFLQALSASR